MKRNLLEPIDVFAYGENYSAKGKYFPDGKLKVIAGSLISPFATNSVRNYVLEIREMVLKKSGNQCIMTDDFLFENPSLAASVVSGNMRSGNLFWMTVDNIPLGVFLEIDERPKTNDNEIFLEGERHIVNHDELERNPKARKACLDYYGYSCQICGFDFKEEYGDEFGNIIQVHHIKPISAFSEEHEVDPIKDLIPVCPNCHVALHSKKGGVYLPKEIKEIVEKRRTCRGKGNE